MSLFEVVQFALVLNWHGGAEGSGVVASHHEWWQSETFLLHAALHASHKSLTARLGGLEDALLLLGAFSGAGPVDDLLALLLLPHQSVHDVDESVVLAQLLQLFLDALFLFFGLAALRVHVFPFTASASAAALATRSAVTSLLEFFAVASRIGVAVAATALLVLFAVRGGAAVGGATSLLEFFAVAS